MARRKSKARKHVAYFAAGTGVIVCVVIARAAWHMAGYLVVTAAVAALSYAAGRARAGRVSSLAANVRKAARQGRVIETNAVSAYPPGVKLGLNSLYGKGPQPGADKVRAEVSGGLASLGWPKTQTAPIIRAVIESLTADGREITSQAVMREVLKRSDNSERRPA